MAAVAAGIAQQVILMLRFGFPEITCRNHFGNSLAGPEAGGIYVGDGIFGNPLLLVAGIEDRGSIAASDVIALAIARARVVDLEEELENLPVADASRIEDD